MWRQHFLLLQRHLNVFPSLVFPRSTWLYLHLGLDLLNLDHWLQSEVLTVLLVHLAVHPDHGIVHLLVHTSHLQLVQVTVLLILLGNAQVSSNTDKHISCS